MFPAPPDTLPPWQARGSGAPDRPARRGELPAWVQRAANCWVQFGEGASALRRGRGLHSRCAVEPDPASPPETSGLGSYFYDFATGHTLPNIEAVVKAIAALEPSDERAAEEERRRKQRARASHRRRTSSAVRPEDMLGQEAARAAVAAAEAAAAAELRRVEREAQREASRAAQPRVLRLLSGCGQDASGIAFETIPRRFRDTCQHPDSPSALSPPAAIATAPCTPPPQASFPLTG